MRTQSKAEILNVSRRRERQRRRWYQAGGLVLVVIIVGLFIWLLNWSFLRVKVVVVSGETDLGRETIKAFAWERLAGRYLGLVPKDSIFFITDNILSEAEFKERFPGLVEAQVSWPNLNTLAVKVTDRQSKILWCTVSTGKQCYYLAPSGLIYQTAPNFSSLILTEFHSEEPVHKLREQVIEADVLKRALLVTDFVQKYLVGWSIDHWELTRIEVKTERDFALVLSRDGEAEMVSRIIFNTDRPVNDIAIDLNSVLSDETFLAEWRQADGRLEYLDLRFAGKVFYRFRP